MADWKEEGEGEKEFHKCKVGEKIGGVIWQTFDPDGGGVKRVWRTFLHSQECGNEEGAEWSGAGGERIVARG